MTVTEEAHDPEITLVPRLTETLAVLEDEPEEVDVPLPFTMTDVVVLLSIEIDDVSVIELSTFVDAPATVLPSVAGSVDLFFGTSGATFRAR